MDLALAPFYAGWATQNQRLTSAIAPLTPPQLLLQAAPGLFSVGVMAAHIIGTRAFWFHQIMGEGPPQMAAWLGLDDLDDSARPVETLLAGFAETWAMIDAVLTRCTPANLDDTFQRIYPDRVRSFTRQALILRVLGHDFHHGGEISLTLGMNGLEGVGE